MGALPCCCRRVAESVYWIGRYLERAEATARIIKVHTELFLDLPRPAGLVGPPAGRHRVRRRVRPRHPTLSEEDVIGFLAVDADNPGSVIAALLACPLQPPDHEGRVPQPGWDALNALHRWSVEHADEAVDRRTRLRWMAEAWTAAISCVDCWTGT